MELGKVGFAPGRKSCDDGDDEDRKQFLEVLQAKLPELEANKTDVERWIQETLPKWSTPENCQICFESLDESSRSAAPKTGILCECPCALLTALFISRIT